MSIQGIQPYRIPHIDKSTKRLLDPHVVIVGAGASIAACPIDKHGRKVPVLRNIHEILGLNKEIEKYGFESEHVKDFETFFSDICDDPLYSQLVSYLENEVRTYFQSLKIVDEPTYYDYLLLSLTEKDAIISFNWDPFLLQAYHRNISVGNLPQIMFPHGNVGVGLCYNCKVKGYAHALCPKCNSHLENMPLLYPVKKKNYQSTDIIKNEWALARAYLSKAAGVTIYGYGAPESDVEAMELLKTSYHKSNIVEIAPFTIINLKQEKELQLEKWKDIYSDRMIMFCESLEETMLWQNPRLSLETIFDAILQMHPRSPQDSFKNFKRIEDLQNFASNITGFEMHI